MTSLTSTTISETQSSAKAVRHSAFPAQAVRHDRAGAHPEPLPALQGGDDGSTIIHHLKDERVAKGDDDGVADDRNAKGGSGAGIPRISSRRPVGQDGNTEFGGRADRPLL